MIEISIIITCVLSLIILKIVLNVNFKEIRKFKTIGSEELEEISKNFPDDNEICKKILEKLNKKEVKVKKESEYNSCLYTVFNNTITIGNFKQNYMKIQTLAHECIHSSQDKVMLWSNFIFTNIYLIYYTLILVLAFLNKLCYPYIHIILFIFLSLIQYILRWSLENEAMLKARYIAEKYIDENNILDEIEKNKLLEEYDRVNAIGIPFMNYYTVSMNIIKIAFLSFIILI